MKGQRLYIRPLTDADRARLDDFYQSENKELPPRLEGLVGFLVGDIAAHLAFDARGSQAQILSLLVSTPLRRKRVATLMLGELNSLASKMELTRLTVRNAGEAAVIFRRLGFEEEADGTLVRSVE